MKFMQIKPQKARGTFKESLFSDPQWWAENKEDGDRRIAQFVGERVRFTGTRESVSDTGFVEKTANLPHLAYTPPQALDCTVLDGEIVAPFAKNLPGGSSKHVTAIMGSSPERAVALQKERGWLEYRVFDCLWYKGLDIRQHSIQMRRNWAWEALKIWKNKYAHLLPTYITTGEKRAAWKRSREGLVFKRDDHTYGDERLWVKHKKVWTADVVVMGYKMGKGKYEGRVGSIVFGQDMPAHSDKHSLALRELGTVRGFDDATMRELTDKPRMNLNRVFEITHFGREPTGAFRSPQFSRWRDDKDPKDCVYREDET